MKKKVALLLALVMVLATLPMNLFGAVVTGHSHFPGLAFVSGGIDGSNVFTREPAPVGPEPGHPGTVSITLPLASLVGNSVAVPAGQPDAGRFVSRLLVSFSGAAVFADTVAAFSPDGNDINGATAAPSGQHWPPAAGGVGRWGLPTTSGPALGASMVPVTGDQRVVLRSVTHNWHSTGSVTVDIYTDAVVTAGQVGFISFDLPVIGWADDAQWVNAHVSVSNAPEVEGAFFGPIITQWPIATANLNSVTWSVQQGGARNFASSLLVPHIRLSENRFGVIGGPNNVIRLEAPAFYNWSFLAPAPIGNHNIRLLLPGQQGNVIAGRPGVTNELTIHPGGVGGGASFQPITIAGIEATRVGAGGTRAEQRHVIYIHLNEINRNTGWAPGLGNIEIRNLWLVPDDHAQNVGNVNIDVAWGRFGNSLDGMTFAAVGAAATRPSFVRTNRGLNTAPFVLSPVLSAGQTANLHVGIRGEAGVTVEVHDGPNNIRTGHLGDWRPNETGRRAPYIHPLVPVPSPHQALTNDWVWNRDNDGLAHWTGVATSTLIIQENQPGGFVFGFGSPINFEFLDDDGNPHPGIRILGMEARAGNYRNHEWQRGTLNNFHRGLDGVPQGWPFWGGANQNWMTFSGWVGALDQRMPSVAGVGRVSERTATVYLPSQTITDVPNAGILEVRFWLSVEAGFEWKYGPEIDVTISGSGVTNMSQADRVQTVAMAQDPIVVTHADDAVQLEVGTLYNVVGRQAISDVTIDVVNNGAFGIGQEIWMYIGTDTPGRNFDLNIAHIPTVTVNPESGLRLDSGRLANPAFTRQGRDAIVFTVTRQPYGGDAPAPQITVSNLAVDGQAWPGINYYLVVSGTSVANNDQEVFHRLADTAWGGGFTDADAAQMRRMNRGVFTTMPYYATTLVNAAGGIADIIAGPGGATGERLSFADGVYVNVDGEYIVGMRLMEIPGTGFHTALFNPRVFADFVGADIQYAGGVATFTGINWLGVETTIVLTRGSTDLVVNGVAMDIAAAANQPQLANRIAPATVDARFFVPVRALANLWGVPVEWTGRTVVLG